MRTGIVTGVIVAVIAAILLAGQGDLTGPAPFVILGLTNGAIFGLVALGLVLVYKGTRVFNFAQGEFGTWAAFFAFMVMRDDGVGGVGLPYWAAVIVALFGALLLGLAFERIVARPLLNAPRVTVLVATIATALLFIGLQIVFFEIEPENLRGVFTSDNAGILSTKRIFNLNIDPQRQVAIVVLLAFGVLLAYFFSRTDLGLAVLATSQDAFATRVVGIGVERMSRFIWGGAALLGGIAALIYVPLAGLLIPGVMTSNILIPAFTGAVVGGMNSLPGAFLGGITIGVVQSVSLWAVGHYHIGERAIVEVIPASEQISILLVLLVILLARPAGLLGQEA
ncbi:MAG TPA: branched-chain amino acid ABC transporter permease [Actinomycetota bacterium]|nr:branched-chain amino acid ABC transporter permease [Actinomycetota bacterium]